MNKFGLGSMALLVCLVGQSALLGQNAPSATAPVEARGPHVFQFQPRPGGDVVIWHGDAPISDGTAPLPSSQYWLGLVCTPVGPALRAHVNIPEDRGVLVHDVAAESPAAEAGIERFDILLSYGDAPVANLADLISAVEASGKVETEVTLVRGGEQTTVSVSPVDRPADVTAPVHAFFDRTANLPIPPGVPEGPVQLQLIHPPTVTLMGPMQEIPAGVAITISKVNDEPATVHVTRGEESWEATAADLSSLPDDLRPIVQRMLGQPTAQLSAAGARPFYLQFQGQPAVVGRTYIGPAPGDAIWMPRPSQPPAVTEGDESNDPSATVNQQVLQQLDQLQQQLDELRRTLEADAG